MRTERKRLVMAALNKKRPKRNQRWLAQQIGVTETYISQLLSGRRRGSVDVLIAISRETGIDVMSLADRS